MTNCIKTGLLIFLLFILNSALFCVVPPSSPTEYIPQAFDVIHYEAQLDLTKSPSREMSGVADIKILWTMDPLLNKFYFHLRSLLIDSAFYDGQAIKAIEAETPSSPDYHFEVSPTIGKAGDTANLKIYYHGTMTAESENFVFGGVNSRGTTLYSIGVGFHNNYVSATQHWLPCYDHPSDKATYKFRYMVRSGMTVAGSGILKYIQTDGINDFFEWSSEIPTATYLMCFAIDDFIEINLGDKPVPMVIYAKQADSAAAEFSFSLLPDMIKAMTECFGDYPFEKAGYVLVPEIGGAMEHQTMISINDNYIRSLYKAKNKNNTTALHELAHQWFGDAVAVKDFRDAWLSESFATYSEALWAEKYKDYIAYLEQIYLDVYKYINQIAPSEGVFPIYDFPREAPSSNYPSTIYQKGAAVLALLRYELGDKFFDVLKAYIQKYKHSNISTAEFKDFLEKESGKELDWFFSQWIYGKGYPVLDIYVDVVYLDVIYDHYEATIKIKQNQPKMFGAYTNLPIPVRYNNAYTGEKAVKILNMTDIEQTFVIDSLDIDYGLDFNSSKKLDSLVVLMKINSLIVSVEDEKGVSHKIDFTLTPNPASDLVNINFMNGSGDIQLEIFDILGNVMEQSNITLIEELSALKINTSNYPTGVYYISISRGKNKTVKSFVKAGK